MWACRIPSPNCRSPRISYCDLEGSRCESHSMVFLILCLEIACCLWNLWGATPLPTFQITFSVSLPCGADRSKPVITSYYPVIKFFKPVSTNWSPIDIRISPIKRVKICWPPLFIRPDTRSIAIMIIQVRKTANPAPVIATMGKPAASCTADNAMTVAIVPGLAANIMSEESVL